MPQAFRAMHHNIEQVINALSSEIPESVHSEQLPSASTPGNQNSTSRSAVTVHGHLAVQPNGMPANATQAARIPMPRASNTPHRSLTHSRLDNSSDACTFGSSIAEGAKSGYPKSSTGKQIPGYTIDTAKRNAGPTKADVIDTKKQGHKSLPSAKASRSKGTTGKLTSHSILTHSQLELEIQKIMPVDSGDQDVQLSDADFDRIAAILLQANREEWSFRPRTYALLRMINATALLDDFVKKNCLDIALPYTRGNLPKSLSPEQRDHFLKKQNSVMTKAASIEGGLKSRHANLHNADDHLEALDKLGEGGSGEVDRIRSKLSRKIYVRKRLNRKETFDDNAHALTLFKREVDHLKKLKHRHLVRYIGSYTDPQYVGIIMDPVAEMDLKAFLSQRVFKPAEYDCIREAFGCLCSAIIYLHRQEVRHKDIKPQNILVKERKVFLTDFGIALNWKELGRSTTTGDHGPISRQYAAPEVMDNQRRNSCADIWSLGCVYFNMIVSQRWGPPYHSF